MKHTFLHILHASLTCLILTGCDTKKTPSSVPETKEISTGTLTLAEKGSSPYTIVIPAVAPRSVVDAANELQRDFQESTGAELPIRKDNEEIHAPFISLGNTVQAQKAEITTKGLAYDGYRIRFLDDNIYIIGIDTTSTLPKDLKIKDTSTNVEAIESHPEIPGPSMTENGGFSTGTANGVYAFLEEALGVRWLMPDEIGRDIIQTNKLEVTKIDREENPLFIYRVIIGLSGSETVTAWREQMRLGYSYRLNHTHSWSKIVPMELYDTHPEWFAMDAFGKRPKPKDSRYKIETTNKELIDYIAKGAVERLKKYPIENTYTLSPSDSLGYSESPESKQYYDQNEIDGISVTPLILKFYRDVTEAVAKENPDAKISGYLYQRYVYPPSDGVIEFAPQFVPVLVSKATRYTFYDPKTRETNLNNIKTWGKHVPKEWFYYDFPYWFRNMSGILTSTGTDYLTELSHTLADHGIKGAQFYGLPWGNMALQNYLQAKMLWNPKGDATEVQRDWLNRAYGEKAGEIMEQFYQKMDEKWFGDYFRQGSFRAFDNAAGLFSQTYGAYYKQMEEMILKAEKQPMTDKQAARFSMVVDNMRVLQWRLRNGGQLPIDYQSPYTVDTPTVFALLSEREPRITNRPVGRNGFESIEKGITYQLSDSLPASKKAVPNPTLIVLYPTQSGKVRLIPSEVDPQTNFIYYFVKSPKGGGIAKGILENGKEIVFDVEAHHPYYLEISPRGFSTKPYVKWKLTLPGAVLTQAAIEGKIVHLLKQSESDKSLYVYVPEKTKWETSSDASGVTIQTESENTVNSRRGRDMALLAQASLERVMEQYQADVLINLNNKWSFMTDPDHKGVEEDYENPDFDDHSWMTLSILEPWQNQGFSNYQGTAWYRKNFELTSAQTADQLATGDKQLLLYFGNIDGDAEVFLNGNLIAHFKADAQFEAWNTSVVLDISNLYRLGRNVIAIKVTKNSASGGLYRGGAILQGVNPSSSTQSPTLPIKAVH